MTMWKLTIGLLGTASLAACGGSGPNGAGSSPVTISAREGTSPPTSAETKPSGDKALLVEGVAVTSGPHSAMRSRERTAKRPPATLVRLSALQTNETSRMKRSAGKAAIDGTPVQIGVARAVSQTASAANVGAMLQWQPTDNGGKVAALNFQSDQAKGVRAGIVVDSLPAGTVMRFYSPDGANQQIQEVTDREVKELLALNAKSGDTSQEGRTYWTPDFDGQATVVEIELAPGVDPASLRVSVPTISHNFISGREAADPKIMSERATGVGASGSCNIDAMCRSDYANDRDAVAHMRFVKNGGSYMCTGTLLANRQGTQIPYFLSANHCIADQTVASTLQLHWFFRSEACNDTSPNPQYTQTYGGATLLYNSTATDTSFMRLNRQPPAGTRLAGWSTYKMGPNFSIAGVHHPSGDWLKFSQGSVQGLTFYGQQSGPEPTHIRVVWNQGITEGGSSGSGLLWNHNGRHYLVGQLHGGSSFCSAPNSPDSYGRFDLAYRNGMSQWLSPQ